MKFIPHDYQKYAISYIEKKPVAAVLLDMVLSSELNDAPSSTLIGVDMWY
jgi:hypothetical protein